MGRELTTVDSTVPIGTITEIASLDTFVGDYVRCGEMVPSTSPIVVNSTPDGVYTTSLSAAAPQSISVNSMIGGNGKLVVVGWSATSINSYISSDGGISWTRKVTPMAYQTFSLGRGYINGRYLYWGNDGILEITADGTAVHLYKTNVTYGLDWDGTQWISALSGGNLMSTSIDLITWSLVVNRPANSYGVFKVGANYVSISSTYVVSTTTTLGTAWTTRTTQSASIVLSGLHKVNGFLVAKMSATTTFLFTADGLGSWTSSSLAYSQTMTDMAFDGTYYIVNNASNIYYRYSTTLDGAFTTLSGAYTIDTSTVACDGTRTYVYNTNGCGALTAGATVAAPYKVVSPFYTSNSSSGNNIYQLKSYGSTNILYNSSVYRLSGETISLMVFDNANKYLSFTESSTNQIYYHIAELNGYFWWSLDNQSSTLYQHLITAGITATTPSVVLTTITAAFHYAGEDITYAHASNTYSIMKGFLGIGATSVMQSDNGNFISLWKTGTATHIWYNGQLTDTSIICKLFSKSGASVALATNTTNVRFWKIGNIIYTDNGSNTGFIYAGTRLDRMVEIFATTGISVDTLNRNGLIGSSSNRYTITPQGLEKIGSIGTTNSVFASTLTYTPHASVTGMFNYVLNDSGLRRTAFVAPSTTGTYRYIKYK